MFFIYFVTHLKLEESWKMTQDNVNADQEQVEKVEKVRPELEWDRLQSQT